MTREPGRPDPAGAEAVAEPPGRDLERGVGEEEGGREEADDCERDAVGMREGGRDRAGVRNVPARRERRGKPAHKSPPAHAATLVAAPAASGRIRRRPEERRRARGWPCPFAVGTVPSPSPNGAAARTPTRTARREHVQRSSRPRHRPRSQRHPRGSAGSHVPLPWGLSPALRPTAPLQGLQPALPAGNTSSADLSRPRHRPRSQRHPRGSAGSHVPLPWGLSPALRPAARLLGQRFAPSGEDAPCWGLAG